MSFLSSALSQGLRASCQSVVTAAFLLGSAVAALGQSSYSGVIAFGDSLSDRGNTIATVGTNIFISYFSHYDQNYYDSAFNEYHIAAEGRWSSGPTWVEYLAGNLVGGDIGSHPIDLGRNPGDGTTGTNFAWAGSTTGQGYKDVSGYQLSNLQTQVSDYISISGSLAFPDVSSALYTVWSGGNDAIDWVAAGMDFGTLQTTVNAANLNISDAIQSLYLNGGRHFVVPNLPSLGFKPDYITDEAKRDAANQFASLFNTGLSLSIEGLRDLLPEIEIIELDIHAIFSDIMDNPAEYGLTNTDGQAWTYGILWDDIADHPEEYLFWDSTHPTTQIHQLLGNMAYLAVTPEFEESIPEPGAVVMLIAGAGLLVLARFRRGCGSAR